MRLILTIFQKKIQYPHRSDASHHCSPACAPYTRTGWGTDPSSLLTFSMRNDIPRRVLIPL
ncbi:hypothetical protein TPADAL_0538a [Treponema pallidum subsp. pallidum DAL-1]|uniref:Uncharacterized protein n=2 Tax=Treponema pallidum TaxID=160 RepID=A0AAU8RNQ2_TREPL|nr:hypothetical protein TPESAMD_0538a [Treponema pallidum subsp. pertenue str. SamoaD]AEZ58731.1 hypothetical protein TPECDC2_0538a [Treponema pallidum subsp. pertenue str. CDC2]AEZ59799.1 hypothetical protein TPEGAU_0538a [Treponema pallidum subsp. pertenue str. Gauthier]AEZ60862.1 hypothetical protein TPADAL_0538a [Treponema pallidum subsp. pallidum DAL-1]AGK84183.1 hypothetical protein TPFB_0538a [Treponema pallidum str. Fribourg-Blanc]AJB40559.1 hypothetical protein TENDBA_0538a [Treponema